MKTKNVIIALLFLPFLMNCSPESTDNQGDIAIVEKYIKAVESLDYATMESLLADHYQGFGPSFNDSIDKERALENWKYNVEYFYKNIKYNKIQTAPVKISSGPNQGNWVSSWAELSITYQSNDNIVIWANTVYKVENNKIVKSLTFYNEADAYRQLGYAFIDAEEL
jgi:hypothetical protein